MSGGLSIDLIRSDGMVIVRPSGLLDARTSLDLRYALIDLLAEQVGGVVIDVDGVSVVGSAAAEAVAAVVLQNKVWPGVPLVIAGSGPAATAMTAPVDGVPAAVPLWPDRDAALAHLSRGTVPPIQRLRLPPKLDSPARARAAVEEFCRLHRVCRDLDECPHRPPGSAAPRPDAVERWRGGAEAAQLVVSELVTNAVVHAGTPITLTLRLVAREAGALLHIGVRDAGGGLVGPVPAVAPSSISGRGLLVVSAFAEEWGVLVSIDGKVVWAKVAVALMP